MTDSEVDVLSFREKDTGTNGVDEIVPENPLERGPVILAIQPGLLDGCQGLGFALLVSRQQ